MFGLFKRHEIQVVRLAKDDVLVVEVSAPISQKRCEEIKAAFEKKFPDRTVLVLGGGISLKIVRAA